MDIQTEATSLTTLWFKGFSSLSSSLAFEASPSFTGIFLREKDIRNFMKAFPHLIHLSQIAPERTRF